MYITKFTNSALKTCVPLLMLLTTLVLLPTPNIITTILAVVTLFGLLRSAYFGLVAVVVELSD